MVIFQLLLVLLYVCCLPRQCRNKEHGTYDLASGRGLFLDGLATFFLHSAHWIETILLTTKVIDVCIGHVLPLVCAWAVSMEAIHISKCKLIIWNVSNWTQLLMDTYTVFTLTYVKWVQPRSDKLGWTRIEHFCFTWQWIIAQGYHVYSVKRWCLESGYSILLFFSLSCGCEKASDISTLTSDMYMAWEACNRCHRTARVRIWLHILSPCCDGCLLHICSEELSAWGTGAVYFGMKLLGIGVRGNCNWLYTHSQLSHHVTQVERRLSSPCGRVNPGLTQFWCACERDIKSKLKVGLAGQTNDALCC